MATISRWMLSLAGAAFPAAGSAAQAPPAQEPLAIFAVAFYGKGANSIEPGDPRVAAMTDSILRSDLQQLGRFMIIDSARLAGALRQAERRGVECQTLDCRRMVSRNAGAAWMLTAKLSKTSNLIWYLSGQLTDVRTGRRLLDDELELKGVAEDIAKGGAHSLARRVVKAATLASAVDTPSTRMTRAQLTAKLSGATDDKPPDLSSTDLSGLDLSGLDFKRANLTGARLAKTKLVGANLFTVDLTDAVLTAADLSRANLDGSVLRRANLQRANLENASLFATIVESADLRGANLSGARIIGYLRAAKLNGASLRHTNAGADPGNQSMGVMRATFVGADLSKADLSDANLFKADFSHAQLTNAKLTRANLMNADLVQADLTGADVTDAKVAQANLDEANFTRAVGAGRLQGLEKARNREKAIFDAK
jgi:uncharacterized protein YjbI with pentapeptide repeats